MSRQGRRACGDLGERAQEYNSQCRRGVQAVQSEIYRAIAPAIGYGVLARLSARLITLSAVAGSVTVESLLAGFPLVAALGIILNYSVMSAYGR